MNAETLLADVGRELQASRVGPALFKQMQKLIVDEMPCGEHRLRAQLWRRLAARCLKAADKHDAVADQREKTARVVRSFAPAFRQTALDAILRGELSIEGPDADALLEQVPPVESIFDTATCTGCRESFKTPGSFERHACRRDSFGKPWGDPENGVWRPLTPVERNTYTIRRRSGWDHTTGDEQRDGRTCEPPAWYFNDAAELEES